MAPTERLVARLALLPVVIVFGYLDSQSDGTWLVNVYNFVEALWKLFFFLLGVASIVFLGVSASGRLKNAPDPKQDGESVKSHDISPATFVSLLLYVALYGLLYFTGSGIGTLKPAELSDFSNLMLFLGPLWLVVCVQLYRREVHGNAA